MSTRVAQIVFLGSAAAYGWLVVSNIGSIAIVWAIITGITGVFAVLLAHCVASSLRLASSSRGRLLYASVLLLAALCLIASALLQSRCTARFERYACPLPSGYSVLKCSGFSLLECRWAFELKKEQEQTSLAQLHIGERVSQLDAVGAARVFNAELGAALPLTNVIAYSLNVGRRSVVVSEAGRLYVYVEK